MNKFPSTKELVKTNNYLFFVKAKFQLLVTTIISIAIFVFGYKVGYTEAFGFFVSLFGITVFLSGWALFIHAYLVSKRDY